MATISLADWSSRVTDLIFETDEHGFSFLSASIRMGLSEAIRLYDAIPSAHVVLSDGAFIAFEGRAEDRELIDGGLRIGAFGYQRALHDVLYTSLWSTESYAGWRPITADELAGYYPEKYYMDNNNRVYITMNGQGETFGRTSPQVGGMIYKVPHLAQDDLVEVEYTYNTNLPAGFLAQMLSWTEGFGTGSIETAFAGSGSATETITAGRVFLAFRIANSSAADPYTNTADVDDYYLKITGLRIRTTANNNVYADEIAKALITYINGINSGQLSSDTSLIKTHGTTGTDLNEAVFVDQRPADIMTWLGSRGDDATPSNYFEWGVWEGQRLHFRARGSQALNWYADVYSLNVSSTLDEMENSVYATYIDGFSRRLITAAATSTASQKKYGLIRHGYTTTYTSSSTLAGVIAAARVNDMKDANPRGRIDIPMVFTAAGARVASYKVRALDTITIRNLPVGGSPDVDKIKTFRISRTRYDAMSNMLQVIVEEDTPSLEELVAVNASRLRRTVASAPDVELPPSPWRK